MTSTHPHLRSVLGTFATGVTVVTTLDGDEPDGMTANAFTSVSLAPPLILVCANRNGRAGRRIKRAGVFAVNILAADQEPLSRHFAAPERPRGRALFAGVGYGTAATGAPILEGVAGYLDCRLAGSHEAGDHDILLGEVQALGADGGIEPLLFHGGRYRRAAA